VVPVRRNQLAAAEPLREGLGDADAEESEVGLAKLDRSAAGGNLEPRLEVEGKVRFAQRFDHENQSMVQQGLAVGPPIQVGDQPSPRGAVMIE
jgi:hypothetical protein